MGDVVRRLREAGWHVILNPDEEDDVYHHARPTEALLVCFPVR